MQRIQKGLLTSALPLVALALALLSGCTKPAEEQAHTVAEYLHDRDLFKRTRDFCKNNPAERAQLPNCVNSSRAGAVTGFLPCFKNGEADHACLDQNGYKR